MGALGFGGGTVPGLALQNRVWPAVELHAVLLRAAVDCPRVHSPAFLQSRPFSGEDAIAVPSKQLPAWGQGVPSAEPWAAGPLGGQSVHVNKCLTYQTASIR